MLSSTLIYVPAHITQQTQLRVYLSVNPIDHKNTHHSYVPYHKIQMRNQSLHCRHTAFVIKCATYCTYYKSNYVCKINVAALQ